MSLIDARQRHHAACVAAFATVERPALTCWPVMVEAAYLLRHRHDLVDRLLRSAQGDFLQILPLDNGDIPGLIAVRDKYRDQAFDLADVCLMHLACRERVGSVLTLDSDFAIFRGEDGAPLRLVEVEGAPFTGPGS